MGWQDWSGLAAGSPDLVAPRFGPFDLAAAVVQPQLLTIGETRDEITADGGVWQFQGQAGDTVTLAAEALSGGDNLWLRLLDDQLLPLAFSDNADGLNPRLSFDLPADGDYFIEVGWFGDSGAFRLTTN